MPDPYGTEPMFEVPESYSHRSREVKVTWRRHKGKTTSCDACIMALHRGEVKFAPTPASNIRMDQHGTRYYCPEHTTPLKEQDRRKRLWNG